jgi:hypothetical protein
MAEYFDSFNRPNTTNDQGLGTIPGGPSWSSMSGQWRILNNNAHSDTNHNMNPIAVVNLQSPDASVQVNVNSEGGGDCVYARVVDSQNWWRVRYRSWVESITLYAVYLERSVNGTVQIISSSMGQTIRVRLDVNGNQIKAFKGTATTPWHTVTDPTHNIATAHGIGRGASERSTSQLHNFRIQLFNQAPFAPNLLTPTNNSDISRLASNQFRWNFLDPDTGDTQSAFRLQYGLLSSSNLTTVEQQVPITSWTAPLGTFNLDDYRWRVQTADSSGLWGIYSDWNYFSVVDPPDQPVITSPSNFSIISSSSESVHWNIAAQNRYQARVVGDLEGSPDTSKVYFDTGGVQSSTARSALLDFPENNVTRHIQVRIQSNTLWSTWASVVVDVNYIPPPTPGIVLEPEPESGAIRIITINPLPFGQYTDSVLNRIQRRTDTSNWVTIEEVPPNTVYMDYQAESRTDYDYRIVTVGENGTQSQSDAYLASVNYNKWFLKDPVFMQDESDHIDLFVDGDSGLTIESHEDQAEFGPLGRRERVIVRDVVRGDKFSLKVQVMGESERRHLDNMRKRQRTLLLQSPFQQWYVSIGRDTSREIQNVVDDYEMINLDFIEQKDPFDV